LLALCLLLGFAQFLFSLPSGLFYNTPFFFQTRQAFLFLGLLQFSIKGGTFLVANVGNPKGRCESFVLHRLGLLLDMRIGGSNGVAATRTGQMSRYTGAHAGSRIG
jgi:hypothetical protein